MARGVVALFAVTMLAGCQAAPACGCTQPVFQVTVFAASSLQPAFDKIGQLALSRGVANPTFNYAGTQTLVSQVTQGAPGDVFASADNLHMAQLQTGGFLQGDPSIFAHNKLEIAVAKGNPKGIHGLSDLSRRDLVVVLADPSVPAGKYAAQALKKAGVTVHPASLEQQVTGVLSKVALGEADAGIVYVSDIVTSSQVDGVTIPDAQNVIADYPVAVLKESKQRIAAQSFVSLILSADGQAILKAAGFEGV